MNLILSFIILFFTCQEATVVHPNDYCTFLPGTTQWYTFSTDQVTQISIITAGYGDGKMELYKGSCDSLILVDEDDNSGPFLMPQIELFTEPNVDYYVKVIDAELFEICIFSCGPLPVELVSYKLYEETGYVTLKWMTGSETNNRCFKIYTSKDAVSWDFLGQTPGANNSSVINYYSYHDFNKWDGSLKYYKLTQVDFNGTETVLGILPIFSKKEYKTLLKEITIDGKPVTKDYNGIRVKVYSDKTVEKVIYE